MTTDRNPGSAHSTTGAIWSVPTRRVLVLGLLRAAAGTALTLGAYVALPLDRLGELPGGLTLAAALAAFVALVVGQVRSILRAPYPGLHAVGALLLTVSVFLVIFASTYYVGSTSDPTSFSEPLSKLDALYFTVTVFTTVGFGDITASSEWMRGAVMIQMLANLAVIGIGVRVFVSAVHEARSRAEPAPED